MNSQPELKIDLIEWLGDGNQAQIDELTFASVSIVAGENIATRVLDNLSQSVRNNIRVSAFDLAAWFASNWWRLRLEPRLPNGYDSTWGVRHNVTGSGGGYRWPDLTFASDGETVQVHSRPNALL